MISVVRTFSVETRDQAGRRCDVIYVIEKPSGVYQYCAVDPNTREQLFIDSDKVEKIHIR
jgi:hypothetical protein